MAYNYSDIIEAQRERLEARMASANAQLEAGRHNEDAEMVNQACDEILRVRGDFQRFGEVVNQFVADQQRAQAQPANKHGLSPREMEIAEALVDRPELGRLSRDQKHEIYARNKARYHQMLRDGSYSDSQGRQREKF